MWVIYICVSGRWQWHRWTTAAHLHHKWYISVRLFWKRSVTYLGGSRSARSMTSYGDIYLGQHRLKSWSAAWHFPESGHAIKHENASENYIFEITHMGQESMSNHCNVILCQGSLYNKCPVLKCRIPVFVRSAYSSSPYVSTGKYQPNKNIMLIYLAHQYL